MKPFITVTTVMGAELRIMIKSIQCWREAREGTESSSGAQSVLFFSDGGDDNSVKLSVTPQEIDRLVLEASLPLPQVSDADERMMEL